MTPALLFLIALLVCVVALNWRFLAGRFGKGGTLCDWWRVDARDHGDRKAWFCRACQREEFVEGDGPPPNCNRRIGAARD